MSHCQPGSPDLYGSTESPLANMERGGNEFGGVHDDMLVGREMLALYRTLDKELDIQFNKAGKLNPSDTRKRKWCNRMIADRKAYKAKVDCLGDAKKVQAASEVALQQGSSTDLTALRTLCLEVVRDDERWVEAACVYVPQIGDS